MSYEASANNSQTKIACKIHTTVMRLAALHSGGKDSAYSAFLAKSQGHEIACLLTISPRSEESSLLHHPNIRWTRLQSESMHVPQIMAGTRSNGVKDEADAMVQALLRAKTDFGADGLVHGGILSEFQRREFGSLCRRCRMEHLAPLWGADQREYMARLARDGFRYVVTSVSSGGLDGSWLGRQVTPGDVEELAALSSRHGFNMSFEGGEAETFVVDCPLFSSPIEILQGTREWDGYRGRFEITDARIKP